MRSGEWRVTNQVEIWLRAARDDGEARGDPVAALCLDIAKDGFPFKTIETFAHQHRHTVFCEIFRKPSARFGIDISVQ